MRQAEKLDPDHLLARWVEARLLELRGELDKAVVAWKWFVDRYNEKRAEIVTSAEALLLVGQAAERYYRASARGEELSDALNDVINDIYEAALRVDPNCWQAPLLEGRLFLSGYNERSAARELARAQQINPLAPEVLVTLGQADLQGYRLAAGRAKAERALGINPHYAPAYVLLADLNISDERFDDAKAAAREGRGREPARRRRAGAAGGLVPAPGRSRGGSRRRAGRTGQQPPAGHFLRRPGRATGRPPQVPLGRTRLLAGRRRRPQPRRRPHRPGHALHADRPRDRGQEPLRRRLRRRPVQRPCRQHDEGPPAHGRLTPASTPSTSASWSTPRRMSCWAGTCRGISNRSTPTLTTRFGYAPPGRTKIEILKNHQWFSGRTIGLPFVPTVGACTGRVVALASPRATRIPFNWARVLTHEVVHVITLQQTEFNIPHWYTEALAVESEGFPRPQEWNRMLLERVPKRSKLLNLDTINLGFIRPKEPDDRQMAYCQAQLYARYMLKRFGDDALIKMLMAYRRGLTTDRAIADCFHVEKADFEKGYLSYLDEVIKTIRTRVSEEKPVKFSQLERQLKEKPDDPDLNARMAYEHFARRDFKEARPFADKALEAQAAPPAGQLRQGPAPGDDRRRRRRAGDPRAGARPQSSPTSG